MQTSTQKTVAIILAGGAGSRLSGIDKGLATFESKRLIEHVIERVSPQVDDIIICANRNLDTYLEYGYTVVSDAASNEDNILNYQGPMAGISSSLAFTISKANYNDYGLALITPCDAPRLPKDLCVKLKQGLINNKKKLASVAHDGERRQNLHCLIRRESWKGLVAFYQAGNRAMHRWYDDVGVIDIDFSEQASSFKNLNRHDDF